MKIYIILRFLFLFLIIKLPRSYSLPHHPQHHQHTGRLRTAVTISEITRFESLAGVLTALAEVLRGFSQFLQANIWIKPGQDRFLPVHHFTNTDHLSFDAVA
jgi:hypothetical protein